MNTVISIENMNKSYKAQHVLKGLDWHVNQGDIVGLLGKNGAGKSTLLKGILNLNDIDSGVITIFGEEHTHLSSKTKARIGYVPQENDEISWLTVSELIAFRKQFYTVWCDEKVNKLLALWAINLDKEVGKLSPGQMQRVLIILALAPKPELIIFDEPAAALDPAGRRLFLKELISLANEENITIIFSTHITSDLERVANKVAILEQGHICYFDELDNAKENVVGLSIHLGAGNTVEVPNLLRTKQHTRHMQCVVSRLDAAWLEEMKTQQIEVTVNPLGLEDIFLELTA